MNHRKAKVVARLLATLVDYLTQYSARVESFDDGRVELTFTHPESSEGDVGPLSVGGTAKGGNGDPDG